jgi:hypothetical protein
MGDPKWVLPLVLGSLAHNHRQHPYRKGGAQYKVQCTPLNFPNFPEILGGSPSSVSRETPSNTPTPYMA